MYTYHNCFLYLKEIKEILSGMNCKGKILIFYFPDFD